MIWFRDWSQNRLALNSLEIEKQIFHSFTKTPSNWRYINAKLISQNFSTPSQFSYLQISFHFVSLLKIHFNVWAVERNGNINSFHVTWNSSNRIHTYLGKLEINDLCHQKMCKFSSKINKDALEKAGLILGDIYLCWVWLAHRAKYAPKSMEGSKFCSFKLI